MKLLFSCRASFALTAALAASPLAAQSPSAAAGYVTLSLPATAASQTNYFTPPLLPTPAYSGTASAVAASTLAISRTDWKGLSWTGAPYYVLLTSGAQAGRVLRITANTASTLTLDTTDDSAQTTSLNLAGFAVAAGDQFEIIPAYTLATFFGATAAEQVLTPGATAAAADEVSLWNWKLNRYEAFYFSSQAGTWLSESAANANGAVIPPGALIAITRRSGRPPVSLVQLGRVPRVAPLIKLPAPVSRVTADSACQSICRFRSSCSAAIGPRATPSSQRIPSRSSMTPPRSGKPTTSAPMAAGERAAAPRRKTPPSSRPAPPWSS